MLNNSKLLCFSTLFFLSTLLISAILSANQPDMSTFFKQETKIKVCDKRLNLFKRLLTGRRVLHVGCTDYPIFDPLTNLHLELAKVTSQLDGCDKDVEGIEQLKKYYDGIYFTSLSNVNGSYDYVLVPEVIEHIGNVEEFLKNLSRIDTKYFIITSPNAFFVNRDNEFYMKDNVFYEEVHPDHNCWYSPYTLTNCIKKYTSWSIQRVYLLEKMTMVAVLCEK